MNFKRKADFKKPHWMIFGCKSQVLKKIFYTRHMFIWCFKEGIHGMT